MPSRLRANAKSSFVCLIVTPVADGHLAAAVGRLAMTGYGRAALRVNNIFRLDGNFSGRIVLPQRIATRDVGMYSIDIKGKYDQPI
jgi:hypothetical protein